MVSFSLVATLSTFLFQTIGTHILSTNDYGVMAKWLTDFGYLGVFLMLGLDSALLYHAKKGESVEENMLKNFIVYTGIIISSLLLIFILPIEKIYYASLFISIYFFSIINAIRASFQYKQNFLVYNLTLVLRPILILLVFSIFFFANEIIEYPLAMMLYSICLFTVGFGLLIYYIRITKIVLNPSKLLDKLYFAYGLKSILNKVLSLSLYASTVYCLSYMSTYEMIGFFFVASSISKMVWVVPDSAGNILYPTFLKVKDEKDNEMAIKGMFYYAQVVFIINLLCLFGFGLFGYFILDLLYTPAYGVNYLPILILLLGNQGMVYYKLISRYLASKNDWNPLYYALTSGLIVNIGLNFMLIPAYGLIGAAIATSLSFWCCGLVLSIYLKNSFIGFINVRQLWCSFRLKEKFS